MTLNSQTKDAYTKNKAGAWKYDIVDLGMKINLADVNAAIGLAQMRQYDSLLIERKRIFEFYDTAFTYFKWAKLPPSIDKGKESSYHIYALRINNITEQQRDKIIIEISKNKVAVNVHFIPLPMLTLFKNYGYKIEDFPNAYRNYACEISLPIYPQLRNEDVEFVISCVKNAYEKIILNQ